MGKVMGVISFVWGTSSTQHRFQQLVAESEEATHDDLLLHKALEHFCALLDDVKAFLRSCNTGSSLESFTKLELFQSDI